MTETLGLTGPGWICESESTAQKTRRNPTIGLACPWVPVSPRKANLRVQKAGLIPAIL